MEAKFPTLNFELDLWNSGFTRIAGIDEAGRGAWAGPVCAAAVVLPPDPSLLQTLGQVRDSKLMTPLARGIWAPRIQQAALAWGVGFASSGEIDALGILPATKLAAARALLSLSSPSHSQASFLPDPLAPDHLAPNHLSPDHLSPDHLASDPLLSALPSSIPFSPASLFPDPSLPDYPIPDSLIPGRLIPDHPIPGYLIPDYLLTDYLVFPNLELPQTALVKGDRLSLTISAASVLAKTSRDALMREMDARYPDYGFARHKGYGTRLHQAAIRNLGLCEIHRKSFSIPSTAPQ